MLADVRQLRPDYVIVHKIDRLARNREDDIAINLALKKHGVKLISCTENIDDTPSGRLLYGLMAEIAQFYSGNLALEVMKGLVRKAEEGGTPFRAPLGYNNRREAQLSVERSWVELDPVRSEIVRWCFEQYATGEWSAIDLTFAARAKGLTSKPTSSRPGKPISLTTMYNILANPYYMGVVSYQGIHYEGKHQPLVEPETWLAVQDVLAAHNHTGEKDRVHRHYLRSTIYCSACGGRLVFSRHRGRRGGTYDYFLCLKRKTKENNCLRPGVRVERIEEGIARFYGTFQFSSRLVEQTRAAVRAEHAATQAEASRGLRQAQVHKQQAQDERQKLLAAHYAGAIPQDLLATEMQRLTRMLAAAEAEIAAASSTVANVEQTLTEALAVAGSCEQAYLLAPDSIKRQINQGLFVKLFIGEDGSVERTELTEPFAALVTSGMPGPAAPDHLRDGEAPSQNGIETVNGGQETGRADVTAEPVHGTTTVTEGTKNNTPSENFLVRRVVKENYLVELRGIEPLTFSMRTRRATNCATAP